jgi:hypothetical protein
MAFSLSKLLDIEIPQRFDATLNMAGSGQFTVGTLRVSRLGNKVLVNSVGTPAHNSGGGSIISGIIIPVWARPDQSVWNTYYTWSSSDRKYSVSIQPNGEVRVERINDLVESTTITPFTIAYNMPDDGLGFKTIRQILGF